MRLRCERRILLVNPGYLSRQPDVTRAKPPKPVPPGSFRFAYKRPFAEISRWGDSAVSSVDGRDCRTRAKPAAPIRESAGRGVSSELRRLGGLRRRPPRMWEAAGRGRESLFARPGKVQKGTGATGP